MKIEPMQTVAKMINELLKFARRISTCIIISVFFEEKTCNFMPIKGGFCVFKIGNIEDLRTAISFYSGGLDLAPQ